MECAGAPVRLPEPENATPGVPGGPFTSPAKAALALRLRTTAATETATPNLFMSRRTMSMTPLRPRSVSPLASGTSRATGHLDAVPWDPLRAVPPPPPGAGMMRVVGSERQRVIHKMW